MKSIIELDKLNHPKPAEWFNAVSGHIFRAIAYDFLPESMHCNGITGHHYKIPRNTQVDWANGGTLPWYDIPISKHIFILVNKKIKTFPNKYYVSSPKKEDIKLETYVTAAKNKSLETRTAMVPMSNYKFSNYSFLDSCHEMIYQLHKEKDLSIIISVTTIDPLSDLILGGMIVCHE